MFKYVFWYSVIFFLRGIEPACSQTAGDSVVTVQIYTDSLYKPVPYNGYLSEDTVREVGRKQVSSYLKNPDYAYANDPEYWKKQAPQEPGIFTRLLFSTPVRWILLFLVAGIVLYGMYQLAGENNLRWFSREGRQSNSQTDEQVPDEMTDYDKAIQKYQAEGNYRLAVRFMYLRLIRTAREKSGISFRGSSTNAEIVRAFGNNPQVVEFRYLTTAYEYIFYGGYIPEPELYGLLKNKFEAFQQNISV